MNAFGNIFRIQLYGESHGPCVGLVLDGVPPGIPLSPDDFIEDIDRRRPGAAGTTARREEDIPKILSGWFNGYTTGSPMHIQFANTDVRSSDYDHLRKAPRPGHADFVAHQKFSGYEDYRGGGHFSGRLTLPLVAAGVVAKKICDPMTFSARLEEAGGDPSIWPAIEQAASEGDSVGGLVDCIIDKVPTGLGEPFFNSLESSLAHAIFSIPAVKGIEFGAGFRSAKMKGSEWNDVLADASGKTITNHAGGINGGISNGNPITFRIAVKPTSSIRKEQVTYDWEKGEPVRLSVSGRHDACIALRVPVVVEAVSALVVADYLLLQKLWRVGQKGAGNQ
ncbi:MAG: chorismate synthase [Saprospiraceae bacterium]|nr:chorismate synthase [Saprospiraceae bacterium]